MIFSFSGLDGAGKSTLISSVKHMLTEKEIPFICLAMYDHIGVYALVRQLRDRFLGKPKDMPKVVPGTRLPDEKTRSLRGGCVRLIRSRAVKRGVLLTDIIVFLLYRLYFEFLQRKILIVDRYFYDSLVDIADGKHWGFIDTVFAFIPVPRLPCFIDVDAQTSFSRKGEYTREYLGFRYNIYNRLFKKLRQPFFLRNESLAESKSLLALEVTRRIGETAN